MNKKEFYTNLFLNHKLLNNNKLELTSPVIIADSDNTFRILIFTETEPNEEENQLLESIIKACGIEKKDYQILSEKRAWRLINKKHIKEVILFGVNERELDVMIDFPLNWPTKFDQKVWIKTSSIQELLKEKELKNALWFNALKPYYLPSPKK